MGNKKRDERSSRNSSSETETKKVRLRDDMAEETSSEPAAPTSLESIASGIKALNEEMKQNFKQLNDELIVLKIEMKREMEEIKKTTREIEKSLESAWAVIEDLREEDQNQKVTQNQQNAEVEAIKREVSQLKNELEKEKERNIARASSGSGMNIESRPEIGFEKLVEYLEYDISKDQFKRRGAEGELVSFIQKTKETDEVCSVSEDPSHNLCTIKVANVIVKWWRKTWTVAVLDRDHTHFKSKLARILESRTKSTTTRNSRDSVQILSQPQIPTEKPQHIASSDETEPNEPDPSLVSSSHGQDGICSGTSRVECSKEQSLNLGRELQELREKIELLNTKVNMQIKSLHTSEESIEIQQLLRMNEKQQERITALEQERNSLMLALRLVYADANSLNQNSQPRQSPPDSGEQSFVHLNENSITEKVSDNEFQQVPKKKKKKKKAKRSGVSQHQLPPSNSSSRVKKGA